MAGVLSFALGLESSAFASGLDRAGGRLLAFLSVGKLVQVAFQGIGDAIARGGALQDLSARTGESVATLYKLEEAFKVVGIGAEAVPNMINRLNKSLSGVGEMGEKTGQAFTTLGLDVGQLKRMDAPAQFNAVAAALAKLGKAEGMDVASRLFGREGAQNMMQISRDSQSFRETIAAAAREASVFARYSAAFDLIGDTVIRMKSALTAMFGGIAGGMAPAIQSLLNLVNKFEWVKFGEEIGKGVSTITNAFKEGKFWELMKEGFKAVFDFAKNLAQSFGYTLAGTIASSVYEGFLKLQGTPVGDLMNKAVGADKWKAWPTVLGVQKTFEGLSDKSLEEAFTGWKNSDFLKMLDQFKPGTTPMPGAPTGSAITDTSGIGMKPSATSLEKMGFVFSGGSQVDYAKETASNTRKIVTWQQKLYEAYAGRRELALVNS